MGLFDSLLTVGSEFLKDKKGGETITQEQMIPTWQKELQQMLGEWGKSAIQNFTPGETYSGKFTADMTGQESKGLDILNKALGLTSPGEMFQAAKGTVMDTLGGKYLDPATSPYVSAMTKLSNRNLQDSIDAARRSRGSRGTYFHSKGVEEESDLQSKTLDYLNTIIGQQVNQERSNMLNLIPTAVSMGQYEDLGMPLQQVAASQQYGGLERLLEQSDLESQYQDWVRSRNEMQLPLNTATTMATQNQNYGIKDWTSPVTYEDNAASMIMRSIPQLLSGGMSGMGGTASTANAATSTGFNPMSLLALLGI